MRRTLRQILQDEPAVEVVADAGDLDTAVRDASAQHAEVLLLALGMSHGSSLETIQRLRHGLPHTAIVAITMQDGPRLAHHALDAGALAFVLTEQADAELPQAVRYVARREQRQWIPRSRTRVAGAAQQRPDSGVHGPGAYDHSASVRPPGRCWLRRSNNWIGYQLRLGARRALPGGVRKEAGGTGLRPRQAKTQRAGA
jgi:DNA-binding NarL/FixJ family response regulator